MVSILFYFLGAKFRYKDEKSLEELIIAIFKMKIPLNFSRLGSHSLEVSTLRKINIKWPFFLIKQNTLAPFLVISDSWSHFEANMSGRRRYDLRRARKRAENLGDVHFEILCPNPEILDNYLEEIFQVEAASWKGRKGTALLFDNRLSHFFSIYSREASRLGTLRLCFLRINGRPVAVLLAVQHFNRFWSLKLGYDEAFSKCSPGILLMHETIRYAFQTGLEAYEFLGTNEPWIQMWTSQAHPYVTIRNYPFSISGQYILSREIYMAIAKKVSTACRL